MRTFPFWNRTSPGVTDAASTARAHPALGWALTAALGVAVVAGIVWGAVATNPPGIETSISSGASNVPLDTAIRVQPQGWVAGVADAKLYEAPLDTPGAEREVPLAIEPVQSSILPGQVELLLRPASQLRPDAQYRLAVTGEALAATLPIPQLAQQVHQVQFTTPAAPKPAASASPIELRWNEPLAIGWQMPIQSFDVQVVPATPVRTWIDATDPTRSYVALEQPQEGAAYQVTVVSAHGQNGMPLLQPQTYQVMVPTRPEPVANGELPAVIGQPLAIEWNVPIERLSIEAPEGVSVSWRPDAHDPRITQLDLSGLAQGQTYELTITDAVAKSGAPLVGPTTIALVTAPPLAAPKLETPTRGMLVPLDAQPVLRWESPIVDRKAAEAAISIDPAVPGHFEWLDDQTVKFVPDAEWPFETEVSLTVRSGLDGVRSTSGSYLEEDATLTFTTLTNKVIEVDLTRQRMHLWEGDKLVRTIVVATGVAAAPTPTGEYYVQYKMPVARFRGVNPSGSTYDIPNVRWVLPFLGDYTIHGAYWRSNFGTPGSAGCVSMTDADAKIVYDWAPVGTPIQIHY